MKSQLTHRFLTSTAIMTVTGLALAGCTGGHATESTGDDAGFEYGASAEEVNAVLADLPPTEIIYQPGSHSEESEIGGATAAFEKYVEERSGGKLTIKSVYGQAIAGYGEIDDALVDGRIDLAYQIHVYQPDEYPVFNTLSTALGGTSVEPVAGDMAASAAIYDIAWNTEELLAEYEEKGLTALMPMNNIGPYVTLCTEPGSSAEDWNGRTVAIGTTAHAPMMVDIGATPVSISYVEIYEALQRGTADCAILALGTAEASGMLEVAPYVSFTSNEASLPNRAPSSLVAGSSFNNLPLAYQQILFDGVVELIEARELSNAGGAAAGVRQLKDAGGDVATMDEDTDDLLRAAVNGHISDVDGLDTLGDGFGERRAETLAAWEKRVNEMGYGNLGAIREMDEWYEAEEHDFSDFAEEVFETIFLPHRPN